MTLFFGSIRKLQRMFAAVVAGITGDLVFGIDIICCKTTLYLEEFLIDPHHHFHHMPGHVLFGICIGCKVDMFWIGRIGCMTIPAAIIQGLLEIVHDRYELCMVDILRKYFQI